MFRKKTQNIIKKAQAEKTVKLANNEAVTLPRHKPGKEPYVKNRFMAKKKQPKRKRKSRVFYFHPAFLLVLALSLFFQFSQSFLLLFIIMLVHETGHLIAARHYGLRIRAFKIMPFGVEIRFENEYLLKGKKEAVIAFCGPFMNLVMLTVGTLYLNAGFYPQSSQAYEALLFFTASNLFLFITNLFPVLPLDGGRIVKACLYKRFGELSSIRYVLMMSRIFAVLLFFFGFYLLLVSKLNVSLILVAAFLLFYLFDESRNYTLLAKKAIIHYKEKLKGKNVLPTKTLSVKEQTPASQVLSKFDYKNFYVVNVLDKHYVIIGRLTEAEVIDAMMEKGSFLTMHDILKFSIASYTKVI